jgi:ProP effector
MGFEQLAALRSQLAAQAKSEKAKGEKVEKVGRAAGQTTDKAADKANTGHAKSGHAHADKAKAHGARAKKADQRPRPAAKKDNASPPVDPVVHTIGKLQKKFPNAFPKNPAPKLALKVGILQDLLTHAADLRLTEQELRDAIATWCKGNRYRASLVQGAPRVDLMGEKAGEVTSGEAAHARRSGGVKKPAPAPAAAAATDTPAAAPEAAPAAQEEPQAAPDDSAAPQA